MNKHTPGPWKISDNVTKHTKHHDAFRYGIVATERVIAWTLRHFDRDPSNCKVTDQDDEDARLIAAAPDLLAAAEAIIANWPAYWIILPSWPPEYKQRLDTLKSAVSKARGGNHAS